ncbi:hypothetical protein W782_02613, partial [Staphylococcus aureus VET1245S]
KNEIKEQLKEQTHNEKDDREI